MDFSKKGNFLIIAICSAWLVSCGSGRSSITEQNRYDATQAVDTLEELPTKHLTKTSKDIDIFDEMLIKMRASQTLVLKDFWRMLEKNPNILDNYSSELKSYIFQLNNQLPEACTAENFKAYSRLAVKYDEGMNALSNQKLRHCDNRLEDEVVLSAIKKLQENYAKEPTQKQAGLLSNYLVTEYNLNPHRNWLDFVNVISPKDWKKIGTSLVDGYDGKSFQKLIQIHLHATKTIPFAGAVVQKYTKTRDDVDLFIQQLGLDSALDVLRYSQNIDVQSMSDDIAHHTLTKLNKEFSELEVTNTGYDAFVQKRWNQMLALRKVQEKFIKIHPLNQEQQLKWLETLHRSMEKIAFSGKLDAELFIERQDTTVIDLYWFKYRLLQKSSNTVFSRLTKVETDFTRFLDQSVASSTFLDRVLKARLSFKLNKDQDLRSNLKNQYCDLVGQKVLEKEDFQTPKELFTNPGCYSYQKLSEWAKTNGLEDKNLIGPEGTFEEVTEEILIQAKSLVMSHDSALFLPAINLEIEADEIDLSHIDLSVEQKFVDYPVEPTPPEYDGLSFPVAVLINTPLGNVNEGALLIPVKLDFQRPWSGQKWADEIMSAHQLRDGVPGGQLTIKSKKEFGLKYMASVVSFGGAGQIWSTESVLGGKGWTVNMEPTSFFLSQEWWKNLGNDPGQLHANLKDQDVDYIVPNIYDELDEFINIFEASPDKSIYVAPRSIVDNGGNYTESYIRACRRMIDRKNVNIVGAVELTTFKENKPEKLEGMHISCVEEFGKRAWKSLVAHRDNIKTKKFRNDIGMGFLGSFSEPQAESGYFDFYSESGNNQTDIKIELNEKNKDFSLKENK